MFYKKLEDVMIDSDIPAFFKRATGREYTSKETCVNDLRRICALFWNEQLKKRHSDYAKSCDDCIYGVDGCQHEPPCTTGTGKPYYKKRDFA